MDDAARDKLFRLVRLGKTKEVKEALATGALDVNERDSKGDSLLHLAARNGHKPIVKELLRRNCDFDVKNQAGKEAWELAFDFNFAELGAYIREKTGLPPIGEGGESAAAALPAPSSKALDSEDFGDVLDLPGLEPKKPLFDPLGAGREMAESNASGGGRESKLSHSDSLLSSSKPSTPPKSIGLAGGKGRGGVTPPPAVMGAAGGTWRQRVDFEVLLSAINALQRGTAIPNEAELHLDTEFFAQIEKVKEAVGLPHAQQRAQGLEGVVETLWARFAAFKEDDVTGVRLQSELRGLRAKMGSGKDVDGVLDERDRLSKSARETERQVADLAGKLRLLESEVQDTSTRLEEARRDADEYQKKLRAAMRAREAAEGQSREAVARAKDLEVELAHAKDAAAEHRRTMDGVQGTLNEVKRIRVSSLSPAELDDLFKRHDKDNSGDIDATEMKSLVEELCGILERRMEVTRADLRREQDRADHAEADRERDAQRAKETEARLTTQLQRLEQDLEMADTSARTQLGQLQDRMDKQKARLEAALEAAKADGEAEVKRVRHEAEVHLGKREAFHEGRYSDLDKTASAERQRGKTREAELSDNLAAEKARVAASEGKLATSQKALQDSTAQVKRLQLEAAASKSHSVIQEVKEEATDMCRRAGAELHHFCTFVLPLPHEAADKIKTDKLTRAQLEQGLTHMMGKYRGAAEQNRRVNLELQSLKGAMRVNCRVRPLRPGPEALDGTCVHLRGLGQLSMLDKNGAKEFQFDHVYGPNNKQDVLFDDARPLLQTVMDGFNVSVMAYGATGSGKTYTMTGAGIAGGGSGKHRGLVQRMLEDVFKTVKERAVLVELTLRLSMFEIYNEEVRDLLAPAASTKKAAGAVGSGWQGLKVSTDRHGSVQIEGLEEYAVDSLAKGLGLVEHGLQTRATAATNINQHSSRSHLLIRFSVQSVDKKSGQRHSGKMYLIDLAGCENVAQSGAEGRALKEAIGINKSLAALHDVMQALAEKSSHVPYRNSTLTKVLADSLGGQAKCLMYVMISPATHDRLVTTSALKFAARCKAIVLGEAKTNVDKSVFDELAESRTKLAEALAQLAETAAARKDMEERVLLSAEIITEASHFEAKLRDLFALNAQGKKDRTKGNAAGETANVVSVIKGGKKGKKGVKAMYLDDASRHLISKRQVHDELLRSLERGVDAFAQALREKDLEIDSLQRSLSEQHDLLQQAERAKAAEAERRVKRERERRERERERSRDAEAEGSVLDPSAFSLRGGADRDWLSPSRSAGGGGKAIAWDDRRDRAREARGGGRDRAGIEGRPEWDRRARKDGKVEHSVWDGRGVGGRIDERRPQESLYHRGGAGQWGPQARASRNVSARLGERRAQLREMERERESVHGGPRAVSSPQVGTERERGAASVAQDAGLPRLPVSSQPPDRSNLPHIVGGLG